MRLWSIHPKYLDAKGLVALWREALLAKKVLKGKTRGYKNHPQLERFKRTSRPLESINFYLSIINDEAESRGYKFDKGKIDRNFGFLTINLTRGQLDFEIIHLLNKLKVRDVSKYRELIDHKKFEAHPIFKIIPGDIEDWEKIKS